MSTPESALQLVPAARIEFPAEDRRWIAERIEEMLESGQLTLGRHGAELEAQFAAHQALAQQFTAGAEVALTPEQLRALRALGYIQ